MSKATDKARIAAWHDALLESAIGDNAIAKLPAPTSVFRGAIVGVSGSGKGNCAKAWVGAAMKVGARVVCFDPEDEYSQKGRASPYVFLGPLLERCTFEQLADAPGRWLDGDELALAVVPDDDDDAAAEQCADFVELIRPTGNLTAVFDELGGYAFGNQQAQVAQKALNKIATKGRHDGISAIFVSQRLVHVPTSARAGLTALELFNQTSPADLHALEELTGKPELGEQVSKQKPGESVLWVSPMLGGLAAPKEKQT